jgi:mycothiol system anti-sigma-R factor
MSGEGMDADHQHVDCTEAVHVLYQFLDGELTEVRRVEIQAHLEACLPCWEAFDFEAELKLFVGRKCRDTAPDGLRLRILGLINEEPPDHPAQGMFRT